VPPAVTGQAVSEQSPLERDYWEIVAAGPPLSAADVDVAREVNRMLSGRLLAMRQAAPPDGRAVTVGCMREVFPAVTVATAHGAVILVDHGFLWCAYQVAWVVAAAMPYETGPAGPPLLSPDAAAPVLRALVERAVAGDAAPPQVPPASMPARRAEFAHVLTAQAVDFLVAHELAHVVGGHLDRPLQPVQAHSRPVGRVNLSSWEDEVEADLTGAELARPVAADHPLAVELGATLVFEMLESAYGWRSLQERAAPVELRDVGGLASHPPAGGRRAAVVGATSPDGGFLDVPELDDVVQLMCLARGQQLPVADPPALRRLAELAVSADAARLDDLMTTPGAASGLAHLDGRGLAGLVAQDHEGARAAVALTVVGMVSAGPATYEVGRLRLAILLSLYLASYGGRSEAGELWGLVERCVPDLRDVLAEAHHLLRWQ
jgi:hypothetical protein